MEDLARLLRDDRERRGESAAAQSRRLGLARATIAALERGGDARLATLSALLRAFPALSPPLLIGGAGRAPPGSRSLTLALARVSGARVEHLEVVLDARPGGVLLRRSILRCAALGQPPARAALLRALLPGKSSIAAGLARQLAAGPRASVEEGSVLHDVVLGDDLVLESRAPHPETPTVVGAPAAPHSAAMALTISLPTRRLVVAAEGLDAGVALEAFSWMGPLAEDAAVLARWRASPRTGSGSARIAIDWPVTGTCVGASLVRSPPKAGRPATGLRAARAEAGLTTRELGARTGLSAMAISKIERGADTRASIARSLLGALPALSPWSLLDAGSSLSPEAAWWHSVDLHGVLSREEWKVVTLDNGGNASLRIGTRGLVRLRGTGVLRIGLGQDPPGVTASGARLTEVHAGGRARSIRIGSSTTPEGERHRHIDVPESLAARPVTFERELTNAGFYTMTRARAFARLPPTDEPVHEGTSFGPLLPCEWLVLEVRWPRGWRPGRVRGHCWPSWQPPDPSSIDIPGTEGSTLQVDDVRRRMVLRARRPLIGTKLALSWELPP